MKVGGFTIPGWLSEHLSQTLRGKVLWKHFELDTCATMGVSGGQTSMLMWLLVLARREMLRSDPRFCDYSFLPSFANTGKEHEGTLRFLEDASQLAGYPIVWVEYRRSAHSWLIEPKHATYEVVDFKSANRTGQPWLDFLDTLKLYRGTVKGLGPVSPKPQMRLCTAQMKIKTRTKLAKDRLGDSYDSFVGMRVDEPSRVRGLRSADTQLITHRTPLADALIDKEMVLRFFRDQPVRLQIPDWLGNCTQCFLKDIPDIATAMMESDEDTDFWLRLEEEYGTMRPGRWTYREIRDTLPIRQKIRASLERGVEPDLSRLPDTPSDNDAAEHWDVEDPEANRVEGYRRSPTSTNVLILRQEKKRLKSGPQAVSCGCAAAIVSGEQDIDV
jgi:hypothetical protein